MTNEVRDYVAAKSRELMEAPTCSSETRMSAQIWLETLGTENEAAATERYVSELERDIMPIDTLIAFAESEGGAEVFGAEKTKEVAVHARAIKADGAVYCDCPACMIVAEILRKKEELLR